MNLSSTIQQARYRWMELRLQDKKLDPAWAKVYHMMFSGKKSALESGIEIILKMGWVDALSKFVEVNEFSELTILPQFSSQDRAIIAYTLLVCLETSRQDFWLSTVQAEELDLLVMLAAGMETLYEIPDWMIEPLFMASIATKTLPSGKYALGHSAYDAFPDERSRSFQTETLEISRFPVSQFLYNIVMKENPSQSLGWNHPVDTISWDQAIEFCNQLSLVLSLEPVYQLNEKLHINSSADGFRLLDSQEWEAAARFGSDTPFAGSKDISEVSWRNMQTSQPIARLKPNELGLFDMCGSVWQWCQKNDSTYAERKGGSWFSKPRACEVWFQSKRRKKYASVVQGLRVCRKEFEENIPSKTTLPIPIEEKDDNFWTDDW